MTTKDRVWVVIAIGVVIQIIVGAVMYQTVYKDILSIHQYQLKEDQNHNKTTQDLQICQAEAVINHAVNWKRMCKLYGLPESCGLPQKDYDYLAANLKAETATCSDRHQYQAPTVVGPAMDSQGHLLPR